ncbi:MAG: IS66 family insertion sequence element accessory protein TnpB [Saprospiraceae bacterium]|nr:IS66 family insertion sequence element accessory protein TnpB [Saprospiraceae bacterium]MBK9109560.1 IS66 family insertion sequence element accessory protein TnpB [Saprospiraceae bacterium]
MIPFTSGHRYFLYTGITDFRKSYDGLFGIIKSIMQSNPLSGDVYLFTNKRRNQIRMMVYDTGGLVLLSKRLDRGTFEIMESQTNHIKLNISWTQLMCIMQGIKLNSIRYRKRHIIGEKYLKNNYVN